jgi:hypothetical protein
LRNRIIALSLLLGLGGLAGATLRAELLKLSLLKRPAARFTMKLDLFHGADDGRNRAGGAAAPAASGQVENLQKSIAEEIAESVTCEGFIMKNAQRSALLNVSGESFLVSEGDTVLDKIKVLKVAKDKVIIEYENQPYEIRIKGE